MEHGKTCITEVIRKGRVNIRKQSSKWVGENKNNQIDQNTKNTT